MTQLIIACVILFFVIGVTAYHLGGFIDSRARFESEYAKSRKEEKPMPWEATPF